MLMRELLGPVQQNPNKEPTSSSLQSRNILSLIFPLVCSTPPNGKNKKKYKKKKKRKKNNTVTGMRLYFAYVMNDSLTRFKTHPTIQGLISLCLKLREFHLASIG
jgi:hypothetical protein